MDIKIIVITHKDYKMPEDHMYLPICVGSGRDKLREKFQTDDIGDNISEKNMKYCELTGIYWAWKNLKSDYIGVAHYRRHFCLTSTKERKYIRQEELEQLLTDSNIIVPPPRKYYLSSLKSHYCNSKKGYRGIHKYDMKVLESVISELYPNYEQTFKSVMNGNSAHMLNMFIMRKDYFDSYCEWLFSIIFEVERKLSKRIDQTRYAGALSEFLLDVWIKNNNYDFKEISLYELEKPNFFKKVFSVINRKYFELEKR